MIGFQIPTLQSTSGRDLRSALGCFATGVALATCQSGQAPIAVTINSFGSVSLAPAIVSFALGLTARCLPAFIENPKFAIHILRWDQLAISKTFARPATSTWHGVGYESTSSGHLVLDACAAVFLCERVVLQEVGDHVVLFGRVERFAWDPQAQPLAFCHGRYGSLRLQDRSGQIVDPDWRDDAQLAWG